MYEWEHLGYFIDQDQRIVHDWEDLSCPDFFPIGDKHMLLFISHNLGTQYYVGDYKNGKFTVEKHARMNWPGGTFFAPEQLVDDKGRNIIWGWVIERKGPHLPDYGWAGVMSMPRVVSLSDEGEVRINPPEEFKNLRLKGVEEKDISLKANTEKELALGGKALEIQ